MDNFIKDILNNIHSNVPPGFTEYGNYDPQFNMYSESRFREYVNKYDEKIKSEIRRSKRRRSPKFSHDSQAAGLQFSAVNSFLDKVRLQDQMLPEYLRESRD